MSLLYRSTFLQTPEQIDDVIWNEVRFDVIVNLPKPHKGESPLVLKNFTANFTTFFLLLGDLSKDVMFGNLDLKTTSVTINSQVRIKIESS